MTKLIPLEVPFAEKELAKELGATWHHDLRKWCAPASLIKAFARWYPYEPTPEEVLSKLEMEVPSEHQSSVLLLSQTCEYRDWLLLMLPDSRWGAFWADDIDTPAATAIFEGDYDEGCRFVGDSPVQALDYMRRNLIRYDTPEPAYENDHCQVPGEPGKLCDAELHIAGLTIPLQLPEICALLAKHLVPGMPLDPGYSQMSLAIYQAMDRSTPPWIKPPQIEDQALACEISRCLRVPLPEDALVNRKACREFITQYRDDLTLYRQINRRWYEALNPLSKEIRNYSRWTYAREQAKNGVPWEVIASNLELKTKASIDRYMAQADEYEKAHPDWVKSALVQRMCEAERKVEGFSRSIVMDEIYEESWSEFRRERRARQLLSQMQDNCNIQGQASVPESTAMAGGMPE